MTCPSDRELVALLKEGDLEALGDLYNRHRHMVYRTAMAITGDQEAANDLLQDTFLRLFRFADHIDLDRPLEPWLYRMTANLSYNWVQSNRRGLRLLEDLFLSLRVSVVRKLPHELAEEKDEWERVQEALFSLPLPQRVVVVMYYLNDLPLQEIADTLGVPIGTVKSRLHYGRRMLQNSLALGSLAKGQKSAGLKYENA